MAAPTVYRSTDASAPTLDGQKGSLITVLKACLVNGYGAKTAAGWTIALDDAVNHKIIFRNNAVTGSGRYFRIQDNGRIASGTTSYHTTDRACNAALVGMRGYSDIDTPIIPFPRVMTGTFLHNDYAYGVTIRKSYNTSNADYVKPWIVIADSRTCYIITTSSSLNSTTLPTSNTNSYNNYRGITGFGDIKQFNPDDSTMPKAFVMGGDFGELDVITGGLYAGSASFQNLGYINNNSINGGNYLDLSIENSANSVHGGNKGWYLTTMIGGSCNSTTNEGEYMHYPSPMNADAIFQPIIIHVDTYDSSLTYRYVSGYGAEVGVYPGFYGCPHSTASVSYRIGDELSVVTKNGEDYLIYSLLTDSVSQLISFKLGDWWV